MKRILIVDDHEVVREGLKTLLSKFRPEWEVCGEAQNGKEGIRLAASLKPDVVLMDVTMPKMSGLEACSEIRKSGITCPVLIFTMHDFDQLATEAQAAGAQGYVVKAQAARHLVNAIDTLLAGGTFFGGLALLEKKKDSDPNPGVMLCGALELAFA